MKKGKQFFYFLNSWGKKFCPRKNKRGETIAGGIGKIAEGDLTKNVVRLSHPNESGGGRRLENQSGMAISRCNYLLMKAMVGQCSAEGIRKVREAEKSGKIQAVSLDDDGIFSDDEGGYLQTSCAINQGIIGAIRSLNSRPAAIQMPTSCTTNRRPLMNQLPVANERAQVNQTPIANRRHLVSQTPVANGKTLMNQTSVANGRSLMSQVPAANGKPLMSQIPASNGRLVMSPNGRPQMSQIYVASGQCHTNKIPGPEVHPAPLACHAKVSDLKLNIEKGKMKALRQKLTGSGSRVILKQEEAPTTKVTWTVATKKQDPGLGLLKRATRLLKKWPLRSMPCRWDPEMKRMVGHAV
ncbi:uncharacterized protein LOC120643664 isoform X3 [Panicum virgatum]|uniref:uncharacterized protein LOC120643664 isoform X3 n=1 Tax=Panicum virgatum TaxID=38727 RepID=UPI0019D52A31|nr:uncharacterized protein LOC120643664 isoform X3 [Panicum virgatum]